MIAPLWRRLKQNPRFRAALGFEETLWTRKVTDDELRRLIRELDPGRLSVLEISGSRWAIAGLGSYHHTDYPDFDVCSEVLPERFDLIIAEHLLEHVRFPARAVANALRMLRPSGRLFVVTPFLYKVHPNPLDCTRWTEQGLRFLLEDAGFSTARITTGSWGNRACLKAVFRREYILFNRHLHSLANEPDYPLAVWAVAQSPD